MPKEINKRPKSKRGKPKKKPRSRRLILSKEQWFRFESFFDYDAQQVMAVKDEKIVLSGWIPPDNDCGVCLVPPSITQEQGLALQKILEAQFRRPMLVLTNNIQLVKLRPITDALATEIMKAGIDDGQIVQWQKRNKDRQEEVGEEIAEEGIGIREENSVEDEGDLRSDESSEGDGGCARESGSQASSGAAEAIRSEEE